MIMSRARSCRQELEGEGTALELEVERPGKCGGCNQGSGEGKRKPAGGTEIGSLVDNAAWENRLKKSDAERV
jgi:hypothetical protein